ncbi:hypothetical protein F5882DRAFT_262278, partial [Hyaloscypha sp. PMI_1271]
DRPVIEDLLQHHFDLVAKGDLAWLHELKEIGCTCEEIANLLLDEKNDTPWIFPGRPNVLDSHMLPDFHQPACVHEGGYAINTQPRLTAPEHGTDIDSSNYSQPFKGNDFKQNIAEYCGLAGVYPVSRATEDWNGAVTFAGTNHAQAFVTYKLGVDGEDSPDDILFRCLEALKSFCRVASHLQKQGQCCNSFTLLQDVESEVVVELCRIDFRLAWQLLNLMVEFGLKTRQFRKLDQCMSISAAVISIICGPQELGFIHTHDLAPENVLHACALACQCLSVSLYLYTSAHTGYIYPSFLRYPLKELTLFGSRDVDGLEAAIRISLRQLTCMGEMTGDSVMVFHQSPTQDLALASKARFDLLASPEDIVDTWGNSRFIANPNVPYGKSLYGIEIRGGLILPTRNSNELHPETATSLLDKYPQAPVPRTFHWSCITEIPGAMTQTFRTDAKIIVGATTINNSCPIDNIQNRLLACSDRLTNQLGPRKSHWEKRERQYGAQGGQYLVIQFNSTSIKQPGVTLKDYRLNQMSRESEIYLSFLEEAWGLQVSFCTGIARRVSLRKLLSDVMPAFVEAKVPVNLDWEALKKDHAIIEAFSKGNLRSWFNGLQRELQAAVVDIVCQTLEALRDTGIDPTGEKFVIALASRDKPLSCFTIPCKNENLWAKILKDSEHCATFAYVTGTCLETEEVKCRGLRQPPWLNSSTLLDTTVCQHLSESEVSVSMTTSWNLQNGVAYLIGKPALKARVRRGGALQHPRLVVSKSTIPTSFL